VCVCCVCVRDTGGNALGDVWGCWVVCWCVIVGCKTRSLGVSGALSMVVDRIVFVPSVVACLDIVHEFVGCTCVDVLWWFVVMSLQGVVGFVWMCGVKIDLGSAITDGDGV